MASTVSVVNAFISSLISLTLADCLKSSPKLMHNILEIIESHLRSAKQIHCGMQGEYVAVCIVVYLVAAFIPSIKSLCFVIH